ncbi:hypothetical protein Vadar_025316 [Vaccinium darrowii]|uniref:Uncharacterized protein n=1 Tax=Vaccinium darrowii TaxID=229202 RepID=A0ACB7YZ17_9ERIC|nr:hypothetical protein Vadar_025316 [Vaccinium darrowii]
MFCPSMAAVLVNLQTLTIKNCSKMEMIVDWEEGQEREIPKTLFPQLMNLELKSLPRLTRFCHFTHPIELPLLSKIDISGCRSMNFGPVSAPNFYFQGVSGNIDHAIEFMQKEDQRMEEEQRKEEERTKEEERGKAEETDFREAIGDCLSLSPQSSPSGVSNTQRYSKIGDRRSGFDLNSALELACDCEGLKLPNLE